MNHQERLKSYLNLSQTKVGVVRRRKRPGYFLILINNEYIHTFWEIINTITQNKTFAKPLSGGKPSGSTHGHDVWILLKNNCESVCVCVRQKENKKVKETTKSAKLFT